MNKRFGVFLVPILCAVLLFAGDQSKIAPMPEALTGNAVATLRNGIEVFSMMGIGEKKTWDDVSNKVYMLPLKSGKWTTEPSVPGVAGRLGASAIAAKGKIYLFGGYAIDGQGNEFVQGDVNTFLPEERRWYRAADIPVPVDDAVIGVVRDRFIYLVGGRSKTGPVNNVQVYDVETNQWDQATPFPGTPVFGHAGGLTDDSIVFVDGAKKDPAGRGYIASDECWMGRIDHKDMEKIVWSKLPPHPGTGRFGIVAGAAEHRVLFSGGTLAPHNFKGLSADGKPAELSPMTFAYDLHGNRWETVTEETPDVRADTREIAFTPIGALIVGGTLTNSAVSARVLEVAKK
jgi:N-acetylneuraminic acid mutarotase